MCIRDRGRIYKYISKPWNEPELKRLVEEASALYRRRAKSTARTASYGKNLASLREALAAMKDECQTHVNLEGDAKASWIATLDRAIRWIEQPDSEF